MEFVIYPYENRIMIDRESYIVDCSFDFYFLIYRGDETTGEGEIQYNGVKPNVLFDNTQYDDFIKPYYDLWRNAKKKFQEQEMQIALEAEAAYNSEEARFERLRAARNAKLRTCDDVVNQLTRAIRTNTDDATFVAKCEGALTVWDAYAKALCALPDQEGAPWDGGGENTPWPTEPEKPDFLKNN